MSEVALVAQHDGDALQSNEQHYPSPRKAWYIVGVLVAALLLSALDRQALNLLAPLVQEDLGLSDTQLGILNGLAFVALHAIFTLVVGWAADRYNRRNIILIGLVVWSVMTALCGLARSFMMLLAARADVGAGESVVVPAGYALATVNFAATQRGAVMGVLVAANTVGGGLAMILSGALLAALGDGARQLPLIGSAEPWQMVFLILGAAGLPIMLLLLTINDVRRKTMQALGKNPAVTGQGAFAFFAQAKKLFGGLFLATTTNAIAGFGIAVWAPTLLICRFDIPTPQAGYIVGIAFVVGGAAGAILASSLSDHWVTRPEAGGRLRGHLPILIGAIAGTLLLTLGTHPLLCGAGLSAVAFSLNAINAIGFAALHDFKPTYLRGRMTAWLQFCTMVLGYSVGPVAIALLTDYVFEDRALISWSVLSSSSVLFGLAILGSLVAIRRIKIGEALRH